MEGVEGGLFVKLRKVENCRLSWRSDVILGITGHVALVAIKGLEGLKARGRVEDGCRRKE